MVGSWDFVKLMSVGVETLLYFVPDIADRRYANSFTIGVCFFKMEHIHHF
jgi:hypothetical protein